MYTCRLKKTSPLHCYLRILRIFIDCGSTSPILPYRSFNSPQLRQCSSSIHLYCSIFPRLHLFCTRSAVCDLQSASAFCNDRVAIDLIAAISEVFIHIFLRLPSEWVGSSHALPNRKLGRGPAGNLNSAKQRYLTRRVRMPRRRDARTEVSTIVRNA